MAFLIGLSALARKQMKTLPIFVAPFNLLNETFWFEIHTSHLLNKYDVAVN